MYTSLRWMSQRAHSLASVQPWYELRIKPALARQPDLVEAHLLNSADSDGCLLMSVWQNLAALEQAQASFSLPVTFQHHSPWFARQPVLLTGEMMGSYFVQPKPQ